MKILGLAGFRDAGEVSLDVGGENRNAGARKSLRHHLQRDGLAGSGRAGDEAVAIAERERQPGRLFALADENLLVGIGHLVVGRQPLHRLLHAHISRVRRHANIIIPHLAKWIETINAIWTYFASPQDSHVTVVQCVENRRSACDKLARIRAHSCIAATLGDAIEAELAFASAVIACNSRSQAIKINSQARTRQTTG